MVTLFETVRQRVQDGRYVVSVHAADRLEERGLLEWQVVDGVDAGTLIVERPDDRPNPVVEIEQTLADGIPIKVVWAYLRQADIAKLVTVHFFDE